MTSVSAEGSPRSRPGGIRRAYGPESSKSPCFYHAARAKSSRALGVGARCRQRAGGATAGEASDSVTRSRR